MADMDKLYADAPEALTLTVTDVEGTLPEGLRGTLLRNGPGIQGAGADRFHLLDGYGFVVGLTLGDGAPRLRARHVKTKGFERERAAGRQLQRKVFTNKPARWSNLLDLSPGNGANHDVVSWGGRVAATDAPGHFVLDAKTLETQGPSPLDALRSSGLATLCQMPRIDPATNRLVAFSVTPGLRDAIRWLELDEAWRVVKEVKASLGAPGVILHDLAFTPRWYVAVELGRLSAPQAAWGARSVFDSIGAGPGSARRVYLFSREDGTRREAVLPPGTQAFHLYNAFDDGDDVVVDLVLYPRRLDFNVLQPPAARSGVAAMQGVEAVAHRLTFTKAGEVKLRAYPQAVGDSPTVNPAFFGRRTRYGWLPTPGERGDEDAPAAYFYSHGVARLDFESGAVTLWSAGPRVFCAPPAFAPRPGATGEDDGWLLVWAADAEKDRTSVLVFDAAKVEAGPLARLHVGPFLPAVSHADFVPGHLLAEA